MLQLIQKHNHQVAGSALQRKRDIYRFRGGPLLGWLLDECRRRGETQLVMLRQLGFTPSHMTLLRNHKRKSSGISQATVEACARYLGVQPIVIKLLAGHILPSDFLLPGMTEEEVLDRAWAEARGDMALRALVPEDCSNWPLAARRAVMALYHESTGMDPLGLHQLPGILQELQRAAQIHVGNMREAAL
ncbi:hypothetical protein [Silvimonas iriomotensis]|uniref:HTH cro/C1-type domain-containing protein n=1 Tax=Silvimonas iriomotensis TaxID=449662 RepID=A0ABQ2P9W7_9NEIS|nr:hypothetical protein [Silvimonas iriomotensis]GGP21907.1 hypothetical protein GCM10010970_22800 [Silvimonas iriomotensis]